MACLYKYISLYTVHFLVAKYGLVAVYCDHGYVCDFQKPQVCHRKLHYALYVEDGDCHFFQLLLETLTAYALPRIKQFG